MVFWKRAPFRNVESFDEESNAVPVKVSCHEGDSVQDATSTHSAEVGSIQSGPVSQVGFPRNLQVESPGPVEAVGSSETMESTPTVADVDFTGDEDPKRVTRMKVIVVLALFFSLGFVLLVSGIVVRNQRRKTTIQKSQRAMVPIAATPTLAPSLGMTSGLANETLLPVPVTDVPTRNPVDSPRVSPTRSPSMSPTQFNLSDVWIQMLSGVTDRVTFQQNSPQRSALQWLVSQDPAQKNPRTKSLQEVTERYVAAVFFSATNGNGWTQT